ncbi:MAG: hypothetical protein JNK82_27660 [Myxococcaceae bacterium]|nr:hypothetical protein [Myxococcaceae bacterium]
MNAANAGIGSGTGHRDNSGNLYGSGLRIWVWAENSTALTNRNGAIVNVSSVDADWDATQALLGAVGTDLSALPLWAR